MRDLGLKKLRYQAEGVPWYWTVDPAEAQLTVLRIGDDGHYAPHGAVTEDQTYETNEPFPLKVTPATLLV